MLLIKSFYVIKKFININDNQILKFIITRNSEIINPYLIKLFLIENKFINIKLEVENLDKKFIDLIFLKKVKKDFLKKYFTDYHKISEKIKTLLK